MMVLRAAVTAGSLLLLFGVAPAPSSAQGVVLPDDSASNWMSQFSARLRTGTTYFDLPSDSRFGGAYGFVKPGIWRVTEELGAINDELGVTTHLSSKVLDVDPARGELTYERDGGEHRQRFDFLIFGTDPLTACRLVGNEDLYPTETGNFALSG